jgi:carboxymethylenebutenolidase
MDTTFGGGPAYVVEPSGERRGAVIVIHEIWGLVEHVEDVADRFAAQGYLAVAPDLLSAAGVTPQAGQELFDARNDPDEERRLAIQPRLREAFSAGYDPDFAAAAVTRLRAVVDEVVKVEPRVAVVGFCFGGTYAWALAAADDRVRAVVPFYGKAPSDDEIAAIRCPVLAFYGDQDERLMADLPRVQAAAAAAGLAFEAEVYAGAGHAFFNDTGPAYVEQAASDAWDDTLSLLEQALA